MEFYKITTKITSYEDTLVCEHFTTILMTVLRLTSM